jgi:PAS domain S-box-containing protein
LPIEEFIINIIFLWLSGLLFVTYRRWREALKKKDELENIFSSINTDVIMAVDKTRNIFMCNASVRKMFGYEVDEVINQKTDILYLDRRSSPKDKYEIHDTIKNVGVHTGIATGRKKNGDLINLEIITAKLSGSEGVVLLLKDITDKIKIEEEKSKLEADLRRAEKIETLGLLAGGVAHDLNNTLGAIIGYPDLLLEDIPNDSPMRPTILAMKQSGERAAVIVEDLLTLTRRGVEVTETVNFNSIITEFLESCEFEKIKEFHPKVIFDSKLETRLLNVLGSPVHLSKVVMNLVSNAAEAMPGGGKVLISSENINLSKPVKGYDTVAAGDYIVLTVSDNGIGIPEKDIGKIFEPFYTKKIMGRSGTGLGMAVVWGTVKDHKGYIDVESAEGVGTTFKIYFPVTREDIHKKESAVIFEEYRGNREKILVVDDVDSQREIAETLLKKLNYDVEVFKSGEEAVSYMQDNSADLLVLDMLMEPGIDGLDTYKKIIETHPTQKTIIASGFIATDRVKEALKLGAGAYIKKPYTMENIGLAVKQELEKYPPNHKIHST